VRKADTMQDETEYTTDMTKYRHNNYVKNSRAIVVLWALFSCIYLILNIVVFAQPQWIGDSGDSAVAGFFGLWEYCNEASDGTDFICNGDFLQWGSFLNSYYRACSIMVGISCVMFVLVIICFLLFCLLNTVTVLRICASFQIISALLMLVTCIVYPGGWKNSNVQMVCGLQSGQYKIGVCEMRWAYALAIVLIFDALILAILALVLAAKQANLLPEEYKKKKVDKY
jgi:hypothetical protein